MFYSHVNYSVTKISGINGNRAIPFYSHVNYSVTKMHRSRVDKAKSFTVT